MCRYSLEVFIEYTMIFFMEFRSITSVAKAIDRFCISDKYELKFEVYDNFKDKAIDVKELMQIWHS